uniref:CCHC-type domain-containing protein n=1 Tax=Arundo donax TaxID=35708 RepID=A0A0A9A711_ARUDO
MDEAKVGGPMRRCTNYAEYGHKAKDCPHISGRDDASGSGRQRVHGNAPDHDGFAI